MKKRQPEKSEAANSLDPVAASVTPTTQIEGIEVNANPTNERPQAERLTQEALWEMESLLMFMSEAVNTMIADPDMEAKGRLFLIRGLVQRTIALNGVLISADDARYVQAHMANDVRGRLPSDLRLSAEVH